MTRAEPTAASASRTARAWGLAGLWALFVWGLGGDDLSLEGTSRFLGPLFRFLFPGLPDAGIDQLQWAVRKTAHVAEYALLSMLVLRAFWIGGRPAAGAAGWIALFLATGFAAADETRQSLSTERLGSIWDVGLDGLGAGLGVLFLSLLRQRFPRATAMLGIPAPVDPRNPLAESPTSAPAARASTGDPE